jgi:hypothetical protein
VVGLDADQHRFERLGRGQQNVRRLGADALPLRLLGVAVPERRPTPEPLGVRVDTVDQVVEERLERAKVQDGRACPHLLGHRRQQGEAGRLGLAACCRSQQHGVLSFHERHDRRPLEGAQVRPAEGVDDVMQNDGVEPVQYVCPARTRACLG